MQGHVQLTSWEGYTDSRLKVKHAMVIKNKVGAVHLTAHARQRAAPSQLYQLCCSNIAATMDNNNA